MKAAVRTGHRRRRHLWRRGFSSALERLRGGRTAGVVGPANPLRREPGPAGPAGDPDWNLRCSESRPAVGSCPQCAHNGRPDRERAEAWIAQVPEMAEGVGFEPTEGLRLHLISSEVLDTARRVVRAVDVPVIVDGDTGYGSALHVQRLVRELVRLGARGVLLEDQVWPKRCGHMRDKQVVPLEEHAAKLAAAREAKGDAPFAIVGRTDALAPLGLDEAIRRGRAYKEAGADLVFVDAPETVDQLRRLAAEIPAPLTLNVIEGGRTPRLPLEEIRALGFVSVGYPLTGLFAAARALADAFAHLRRHGTSEGLDDRMFDFDGFGALLGLEDRYAEDARFRSVAERFSR